MANSIVSVTDKILLKIFDLFYSYRLRYKRLKIRMNKNISLGKKVVIKDDAKVEVRYGGSISIGDKTEILDGALILSYGGNIRIGLNCSVNSFTIIYGHNNTTIGNNVLIAGHCMIIPNNHIYSDKRKLILEQGCKGKGIAIEDDVWIGHGCSILDGVTIGKGSVIAAGSVVNRDVPAYCVYGGVPAKQISSRN